MDFYSVNRGVFVSSDARFKFEKKKKNKKIKKKKKKAKQTTGNKAR